jgi:hypothetical protein
MPFVRPAQQLLRQVPVSVVESLKGVLHRTNPPECVTGLVMRRSRTRLKVNRNGVDSVVRLSQDTVSKPSAVFLAGGLELPRFWGL